jgi:hypothetical protein
MTTTMNQRIWCMLVGAVFCAELACRSQSPDEDDDGAEQQSNCESVCLKVGCDPLFDPDENIDQFCTDWCMTQIEDANSQSCTSQLVAYHECVDALTCDEFLSHVAADVPDYPCMSEKQALEDSCPGVGVLE